MLITLVPLLVAIAGALLYALTEGKLSELGRLLFFAGALVVVMALAGRSVKIL